jgi:hypothetical protein
VCVQIPTTTRINKTFYSVHKKHKDTLKMTLLLHNDIYKIAYDFIYLNMGNEKPGMHMLLINSICLQNQQYQGLFSNPV